MKHRLYLGHQPGSHDGRGLDLLLTLWEDGTAELATRVGKDERWKTWSPPVRLTEQAVDELIGGAR